MDWLGDVLERLFAEIGHREVEPPLHLPVGVVGDANPARLGDALQACGDIDAIAHQIAVALLDDVADMDADAEFNALVGRDLGVALGHRPLDFTLRNSTIAPSPVRLTTRPWWTAIVGSIRSLRSLRSRARIRSSSAPASRE